MASILKGQSGQPIQFEVTPNVNGDDVATEQFALSNDLGVGQTWQNVTASRSAGVTYTNNTGKPIIVLIYFVSGIGTLEVNLNRGDSSVLAYDTFQFGAGTGDRATLQAIVRAGDTYSVNYNYSGSVVLTHWHELR